jgi:hypothetical protein
MWFFGCGNRKGGTAGKSTSRYPSAPGQSPRTCHRKSASFMLSVDPGTAYGQPYYSSSMAPSFYYPQQTYTYGMPHAPHYAVAPRAAQQNAYYSQAPAPATSYYTASRKSSSYASSAPTSGHSGLTYAITTQPTNAPSTSRRKVTFGRVDVREFRGGGRGGT